MKINKTNLLFALIMLVAFGCSTGKVTIQNPTIKATSSEYDIAKGLIAYYPFDGDTKNQVEDLYHGRAINTKPVKDRNGGDGKALYFNGEAYVDLGIEFPSFAGRKNFSIACWFKTASSGTIISRFDSDVEGEFVVAIIDDGPIFLHRRAAPWDMKGLNKFDDNEWHHLAVVYNGTKALIYIDGILEVSKETGESEKASNTPMLVGSRKTKGEISKGSYTGTIDELRIYARAISRKEILELYNL